MKYDFDKTISREMSGSVKWDLRESRGGKDIIPMWVADMDFQAPSEIIKAIVKRAEHGIFGYTYPSDAYKESVVNWMKNRHSWEIEKDWITITPGVVPALSIALNAYTKPGDNIVIQPPVYHPFKKVIESNDRVVVENNLIRRERYYSMDFENLEHILKEGVSMLVLCSPHNPVGRVWSTEELQKLVDLCSRYETLIVSDEIHSDLIMPGYRHNVMSEIYPENSKGIITFTAASKTFNLAGLSCSNIIIKDSELREAFQKTIQRFSITMPNIFGLITTEAAYNYCEDWLDELCVYIHANYNCLKSFIERRVPKIIVTKLEGTYLAWLDFTGFGLPDEAIDEILFKKARVWLDNGPQFGTGGEGFQRINLACPRGILEQALNRLEMAFNSI
ncbi:MAG: MalY/PatB family protein [Desulfobacteraceae bacterium]|jgi:cystathionine beta-lyase